MAENQYRCGYVALIGRPNVGKSMLLNRLIGQKISITAHRPQTTRHRIIGVHSRDDAQVIYVDTPGIHEGHHRVLNRWMNRTANTAIGEMDGVIFLTDAMHWTALDEQIAQRVKQEVKNPLIAINKIDKITDKSVLLPFIAELGQTLGDVDCIPISARRGINVERLENAVIERLPIGPSIFPVDQVTDRSLRFVAAEIVREKLIRQVGQEVPYQLTVDIESFEESPYFASIGAVIWVERDGHKAIVIGKQGRVLKKIGRVARIDLEAQLNKKIYLNLWVKVRSGWADNEALLRRFGYEP